MKYLLLLLLPFTAFAEFKVEIKNLQGNATHGSEFRTSLEAEKWVNEHESMNSFGKPERTIPKSEATEDELANQVLEEIPATEEQPEMVRLKKTFTTLITDISAEKEAERTKQERKRQAKELIAGLNADDLDTATTIAGLRSKLKVILKALKESYED